MGGATSPSTKLVNVPAPASQYPGISQQFQSMLSGTPSIIGQPGTAGVGPASGETLLEMMKTGAPTNVGPTYEAMVTANRRQVAVGEQNLLENFGEMGLRHSSSALQADVDYQTQVARDFANILAQYTLSSSEGAAGRRLSAAQTGAGLFATPALTTYPTKALVSGPSAFSQGGQIAQGGLEGLILMKTLGLLG